MANAGEPCTPEDVLAFWFDELSPDDWFKPQVEVDQRCEELFRGAHLTMARALPPEWRVTPSARLAAIILLDQIPRNIYRGTPLAFATDGLALREARLALNAGANLEVAANWRPFFYLPFEHSENLVDQTLSVKLFTELGDADNLDFAIRHCEIIRQFGRFPHRNAALGRLSTEAEINFLSQPGSSF
ncbi:DUF924 family protein [Pararhizobium sp. O133]|uniref:DUF924 family protein n=1 Tax=Pararhizobium sp. O133 TaxID=3449278 RepID=UPI003F683613